MSTSRERGTWQPGEVRLVEEPGEIVSPLELRELSTDELVNCIMERGGMREERAREALVIIRGGPPAGVTY